MIALYSHNKNLAEALRDLLVLNGVDSEIMFLTEGGLRLPKGCRLLIFDLGGGAKNGNNSEHFLNLLGHYVTHKKDDGEWYEYTDNLPPIIFLSTEERKEVLDLVCFKSLEYFEDIYRKSFNKRLFWLSQAAVETHDNFFIDQLCLRIARLLKGPLVTIPNYFLHLNMIYERLNERIESFRKKLKDESKWFSCSLTEFLEKMKKYEQLRVRKHRQEERAISGHQEEERELLIENYAELAISDIESARTLLSRDDPKFLLIENNPEEPEFKKDLRLLKECFKYEFYVVKDNFNDLRLYLEKYKKDESGKPERFKHCFSYDPSRKVPLQEKAGGICLNEFDLILIDLFLGEDNGKSWWGQQFLRLFYNNLPHVPIFILSRIEDYEIVRNTLQSGADYYIPKRESVTMPVRLQEYYNDDLGRLISFFIEDGDQEKERRRNLIGNIRYWKIKRELLWFGDKCYHMINHSFNHILDDWQNANQLLYTILKEKGIKSEENKEGLMSSEDLYCFCMAIWLHDIGHKGNERYGEPHQIRDNHGLISGELILTRPDLWKIESEELNDYKEITFPFGTNKKPAPQIIKEKIRERRERNERKEKDKIKQCKNDEHKEEKEITVVEKIALISMYHKSNCPLNKKDYELIIKKGKVIPVDYFEYSDKTKAEITLEYILEESSLSLKEIEDFISLVAIFRFIDGLDINKNRVGDYTEEEIKKMVISCDKTYQTERLKDEVEYILKPGFSRNKIRDKISRLSFVKIFYQEIKEKIMSREYINYSEIIELAKDIKADLKNYLMLLNYCRFLSVQDMHFDLHASIDEVKIFNCESSEEKAHLEIHYLSNRSEKYLSNPKHGVREYFKKKAKPIKDHIVGTEKNGHWEDGYVIKELKAVEKLLKNWFNLQKIGLWGYKSEFKTNERILINGCQKENGRWKLWEEDKSTWEEYQKRFSEEIP